ncbi:MAG: hypothetical protein IRY99_09030 [Isosphaeraceae bacterium]|nr:hypothetical protein [Isosphaeraceae bacterium]
MCADRPRRRPPYLERLETRTALSPIANTLQTTSGVVPRPGAVAHVTTNVASKNLAQKKHATVLGLTASPESGSSLVPRVVPVRQAGGGKIPFRHGHFYRPRGHAEDLAYVKVAKPGPLTTGVTGRHGTTGAFSATTYLPGDLNGDGKVDLTDLQDFAPAYLTFKGDGFYNPAADANHNGFIGQGDARFLVRNITPLTPKRPLSIEVALAPGDQAHLRRFHVSGAETFKQQVTIIGKTTPGSIVFADSGLGDYTFTGPALPTDAQGRFSVVVHNQEGINNYEFLAIDPYGQQTIRAFPILWLPFAEEKIN